MEEQKPVQILSDNIINYVDHEISHLSELRDLEDRHPGKTIIVCGAGSHEGHMAALAGLLASHKSMRDEYLIIGTPSTSGLIAGRTLTAEYEREGRQANPRRDFFKYADFGIGMMDDRIRNVKLTAPEPQLFEPDWQPREYTKDRVKDKSKIWIKARAKSKRAKQARKQQRPKNRRKK